MKRRKWQGNALDSNWSGPESWRITFADMMTLILAFFIMIVAMSNINENLFTKRLGLTGKTAVFESRAEPAIPYAGKSIYSKKGQLAGEFREKAEKVLNENEGRFFIAETDRGMSVAIPAADIFDAATGELKKDAARYLSAVAEPLKKTGDFISIEGHFSGFTDQAANGMTSLKIAAAVLDYFIYDAGMSPTRFSVAGYGSLSPCAGTGRNQPAVEAGRVEIVVLKIKPYPESEKKIRG
jgi:chemotaxis protein MotB